MLRGLHKASSHFLGRIVMAGVLGFLIISFGIWGIGDIFRGFGRSWLAKVGSVEIGVEQFRQTYNDKVQQLGRRIGRPITPEQARALGLKQQLLGQMLAEAALDQRARQLGLNVSDAEIAREITADPNFKGPTGQFDHFRFEQMIRAAGFTEARYAQEQRRVVMRREIADTIGGKVTVPKSAAELLNRFQNEQRSIDYVALGPAQAGDIAAPTPEALQKYFDDHKILFRAPEYRSVTLLIAAAEEVAKTIEVSDVDAHRYYDQHADRFGQAERREVEQIVFPNDSEAQAAADRIAAGTSFADVGSERGLKPKDMDLGLITKAQLLDKTVADAAFSLPEGGVSKPVAGQFGTVLVHVVKIEPGTTKPFDQVEEEIKHQIALDRARPALLDLRDKIEDDRAAGSHLDEIATKYKLTTRTIEVDRSGRGPDGLRVAGLPETDVVAAAFATEVDVDNEPLQLPAGGFVWYNVAKVMPSQDRSLDQVKDQVEARWRKDQVAERLAAKASELADKLRGGAAFPDLAAAMDVKVQPAWGLKRGAASAQLSSGGVDEVFRTAKGAVGTAQGGDPTNLIVFRVTDISVPAFDANSSDAKRYDENLRASMSEALFSGYVSALENRLGTSINNGALMRLDSPGEPD
jgi:peptidyl-prolyl cis-trans isomerase D